VPGLAVRVLPADAVPDIEGATALIGKLILPAKAA
jgi:hypothetical protein